MKETFRGSFKKSRGIIYYNIKDKVLTVWLCYYNFKLTLNLEEVMAAAELRRETVTLLLFMMGGTLGSGSSDRLGFRMSAAAAGLKFVAIETRNR